ncbi:MAG: hypothetical protein PHX08_09200 [Lachnospiraceae bacterium]|nr:hypothetical protein [Lachnospiraceae bacterium]
MEDTTKVYGFIEKVVCGNVRYYIRFQDGEKHTKCVGVSRKIYIEMKMLMRLERNMIRSDERHLEQMDILDDMS